MLERTQIYLKPIKSLGQFFLVNTTIAEAEAVHGMGKNVLELGSGHGVLTKELCKNAKRVVSVEIDRNLYAMLRQTLKKKNLKLLNKDFFEATEEELELNSTEIMIANVPYKLSSRVIEFLIKHDLQAVLCLQKEFVEHMLAKPGTRNYSRLSVMFQLFFSFTKIMPVSRGNFRPIPKVDSMVVYVKPKKIRITDEENATINAIMQHKKKTVRNAILNSHAYFKRSSEELVAIANEIKEKDDRVFKLNPEEILRIAQQLSVKMNSKAPVSAQV